MTGTGPTCDPNGHCITCGDVAIEMTVVAVDGDSGLALCRTHDGEQETVEIALVPDARPAERLLVHAGTAIARGEVFC